MADGTSIQRDIDRLLQRGVIFSLVWLMGIGSVIAVVSGLRAKRLIEQSNGAASGMGRVWWCLIVGGLGIVIWAPLVVVAIVNNIRQ
jgi:hypothetical protein